MNVPLVCTDNLYNYPNLAVNTFGIKQNFQAQTDARINNSGSNSKTVGIVFCNSCKIWPINRSINQSKNTLSLGTDR